MTDTNIDTRPISATERKTLEKLLDEEFSLLRSDLKRVAEEAKAMRTESIRVEQAAIVQRGRDAEDSIRELVRQLTDDGYTVNNQYYDGFTIQIKSNKIEKAITIADKEVEVDLEVALRLANGRHHQAKKDLMRATLSDRAVELMEGLPKAADLLAEARRETVAIGTGATGSSNTDTDTDTDTDTTTEED